MHAIDVRNLTKQFKVSIKDQKGFLKKIKNYFLPKYEILHAVNDISFSIPSGESVAFIGPNGAGKSTTIKMLTGIMMPTSGNIEILGKDPRKNRKHLAYQMSVVFGHCSKLWYQLPVVESLNLLSVIYDLPKEEYLKRKNLLVDLFSIENFLNKPVRQLSLGERMRCELVASFLHNPKVIFLDEPTIGLDISAKATIRDLLRFMCKKLQCTLLLTSHDTDDIEKVCDRVILINKGQILVDDSVENMKNNYIKKRIVSIIFDEEFASVNFDGVKIIESMPHKLKCEVDLTKISLNKVVDNFMSTYHLRDITVEGPALENVIETFYRQNR
jgi:ABC-2 type transport system ATP-binding protein